MENKKKNYLMLDYKLEVLEPMHNNMKPVFNKVNPGFAKVKIYILYHGKNRNDSRISKEAVMKSLYSIYNVPIIGEWIPDSKPNESKYGGRFGSHGGKLEITNQSIVFRRTTQIYGIINESTDLHWEFVTEKDGLITHEYLTATGYLYLAEFPNEIKYILDNNTWQSMEISFDDENYSTDENGVMDIREFVFSALCVLNRDDDDFELNVEPCFESAQIVNYRSEFNATLSSLIEKVNHFELQIVESKKINSIETERGKGVSMSLTTQQLIDEFNLIFSKETFEDGWGYIAPKYHYLDNSENTVIAYDRENDWTYVGFDYIVDGENVNINFESKKRKKKTYVDFDGDEEVTESFNFNKILEDFEKHLTQKLTVDVTATAEYSALKSDYGKLDEQFNLIKSELDDIKAKDDSEAKTELYSKFSEHLKDDETYISLAEEIDGKAKYQAMNYGELDNFLSKLFTAKNIGTFNKKSKNEGMPICGVDFNTDIPKANERYGNILNDVKSKKG